VLEADTGCDYLGRDAPFRCLPALQQLIDCQKAQALGGKLAEAGGIPNSPMTAAGPCRPACLLTSRLPVLQWPQTVPGSLGPCRRSAPSPMNC